jgi:hypothetical protein
MICQCGGIAQCVPLHTGRYVCTLCRLEFSDQAITRAEAEGIKIAIADPSSGPSQVAAWVYDPRHGHTFTPNGYGKFVPPVPDMALEIARQDANYWHRRAQELDAEADQLAERLNVVEDALAASKPKLKPTPPSQESLTMARTISRSGNGVPPAHMPHQVYWLSPDDD